jgi:uncharacterized coiled-coil DUF342 family protein
LRREAREAKKKSDEVKKKSDEVKKELDEFKKKYDGERTTMIQWQVVTALIEGTIIPL